ncbi:hypothetical protein ACHAQA_009550 [Verticillium albo-atrum]
MRPSVFLAAFASFGAVASAAPVGALEGAAVGDANIEARQAYRPWIYRGRKGAEEDSEAKVKARQAYRPWIYRGRKGAEEESQE